MVVTISSPIPVYFISWVFNSDSALRYNFCCGIYWWGEVSGEGSEKRGVRWCILYNMWEMSVLEVRTKIRKHITKPFVWANFDVSWNNYIMEFWGPSYSII